MGRRLKPGERVKHYRVQRFIASGGQAEAYRVEHRKHGLVVLKQHMAGVAEARSRDAHERVRRLEALVGKSHPNVAEIFEVFEHEDLLYVAMGYAPGEDLGRILLKEGPLSPVIVATIAAQVFQGLEWLHGEGIIHRDVKPANIIVDSTSGFSAKLVDLDIALCLHHSRLTLGPVSPATYEYAAVEVLRGEKIGPAADIYSTGVTAFELLTAHVPFPGTELTELIRQITDPDRPSILDHVPDLPLDLDEYVQWLMALKQEDRPSSARVAREALQEIIDTTTAAVPAPEKSSLALASVAVAEPREFSVSRKGPAVVVIKSGSRTGATIPVPRSGITLGRSQLNPSDQRISRFHVRVTRKGNRMLFRSLDAPNGLVYRDRRRKRVWLAPGDEVLIGETALSCD